MAVTLTEAAKYTTNMVKKGVLEEIVKDSAVMQRLKFVTVVGNAYQYLREASLGGASFYDPNELWAEETGSAYQVTAGLKIMGGDADVDNFLKATRSDKTDFAAETIRNKAKGVKHAFLDKLWYGNSAVVTKEFDGLHRIFNAGGMTGGELSISGGHPTDQVVHQGSGSTGAALSLANVDVALDQIRDGAPDLIVMTRNIRRQVRKFLRTISGGNVAYSGMSEWSEELKSYKDIPVTYDDFLTQTETISSAKFSAKTGGATSSVFLLRFGENDLCGLQNGGLETVKLGQLENKDGMRWRIRWYVGVMLQRTIGVSKIDGVTDVIAVA